MNECNFLLERATKLQNEKCVSKHIKIGEVAAALLTNKGSIYTGVSISGAYSIGMCAERNAIANMLANDESEIVQIVAVSFEGIINPCCVCREGMRQLGSYSRNIEVMLTEKRVCTLDELAPDRWAEKIIFWSDDNEENYSKAYNFHRFNDDFDIWIMRLWKQS